MIFEPHPVWLGVVLILLFITPASIILLRKCVGQKTGKRNVILIEFIVSCILSMLILVPAKAWLSDPFEGPGIWLYFAIHILAVEFMLLVIAGVLAFLEMKKNANK